MEPHALADVMFYNIEIAQTFSKDMENITEAFEKSMLKSFEQASEFVINPTSINTFGIEAPTST